MRITRVEPIILRLPKVTEACDGTQDDLLIKNRDRRGDLRVGRGGHLPRGRESGR